MPFDEKARDLAEQALIDLVSCPGARIDREGMTIHFPIPLDGAGLEKLKEVLEGLLYGNDEHRVRAFVEVQREIAVRYLIHRSIAVELDRELAALGISPPRESDPGAG